MEQLEYEKNIGRIACALERIAKLLEMIVTGEDEEIKKRRYDQKVADLMESILRGER